MRDSKHGRNKKVTVQARIVTDSDAVAVAYATVIAKAAAVVRQRQEQYSVNRGKTSVHEPRNGILAGFAAR